MQPFQDVTKIVFEEFSEGHKRCRYRFSIRDLEEVSRLVSLARPKPRTSRPGDIHFLQATFAGPAGNTVVSFCNICFGHDAMPAEFYAEYLRLSRRHKWRLALLYCA